MGQLNELVRPWTRFSTEGRNGLLRRGSVVGTVPGK